MACSKARFEKWTAERVQMCGALLIALYVCKETSVDVCKQNKFNLSKGRIDSGFKIVRKRKIFS